ncbi:Fanconi anemia group B protein [Phascolarctos cinereus]|uniref:Fanconi anemia group B protein n=1 Tax=Phascolarctos cinereus TaxID=38626 RepID=A0A6P5M0B6_PHACI|nr:Fanconi anemia group B protein [Phascolarctos cinereus]XP_020863059.1 Fanconi anemia group B protein [Phascolarctos cinereus]XP_020863060.1 Fanconi anemia group B protein [Phascolarctos cinereus]
MSSNEQEKLLSYNGEVLIFQLSQEELAKEGTAKTSKLHVRRMTFNRSTRAFIQKSTGIFSMHGKPSSFEMICCSCAADFRTGINLPCVLIRNQKKSVFKYFLLLLHSSNEFEQRMNFTLHYEMKDDIMILNGPSILWRHSRMSFYISSQNDTIISAPVKFSSIKWAGEVENLGTILFGVGEPLSTKTESSPGSSKSDYAVWGTEFYAYCIEDQKILSGAYFLPHAYGSVVTCIHICATKEVNTELRTSLIALTEKNQLIWFQDGVPKSLCQLPFQDPCALQVMASDGGDLLCIVSFRSGDVCAIWKKSFQVASKWQKIKSVLVDDFIGSGTEQLLLVFKDTFGTNCLTSFKITDLGNVNYSNDAFDPMENDFFEDSLQENYSLTVQALERRLQFGLASIQELQKHLLLKERILSKSCKALVGLVQGKEYIPPYEEKDVLVSLCGDKKHLPHSLNEKLSDTSHDSKPIVEKMWYRVLGDHLVVGAEIKNSFILLLNDVTLSLLMDQAYTSNSPLIQCKNSVIKLDKVSFSTTLSSPCETESAAKRIKLTLHNEEGKNNFNEQSSETNCIQVFTAVTTLSPLLAFHNFCCIVMLHARWGENSGQFGESCTVPCGRLSLSTEDISSGKYSVTLPEKNKPLKEPMEDLFALLAVFHKFCFQITSPDCTLTSVKTWLLGHMECETVKGFPDSFLCKSLGALHGTFFNWKQKTPFEGILTVYCRNQTVLFQCLHNLTQVLPVNCVIKQLKSGSKKFLTNQLALFLEKEIVTLKNFFSSAVSEVESNLAQKCEIKKNSSSSSMLKASSLGTEEAVRQIREELQQEKEQITWGMNLTLSSTIYREISLKVAGIQLKSDLAAEKLNNY